MSGYTRADVTDQIANGNTVDAVPLDGEFDALQGAFASVGGHAHNGAVGEGAPITVIGPTQDVVASANSLTPKTDNAIDLGSSSFEWKDLYIDGTANIDSLVADTADINGGTIDGAVIGGTTPAAVTATDLVATTAAVGGVAVTTNTATQTLTNKTINLANNTLVATSAQLAASVSDETGSGALVFASSPALTGVPTAPTAAANTNTTQIATTAHVFAERSNTATLANKTLTSPIINGATISGGSVSGITDLAIADGGTGASDAAGARTNLGLGTLATQNSNAVSITGGSVTGITDLAIADGGTGASTAAQALINLGITVTAAKINATGQLAGRNLIINGQGRINQRGYVSGTATTGANQYTLDRWRVVVPGQNLTFTGDDSKRTMTAPAGGVEQVIEGANIEGGTYVLNWTGTATATVNGTARNKGATFTLTANTNATVRFTSGTFTDVQLELGSVPTPFERLPLGDELARCQRYYETGTYQFGSAGTDASGISYGRIYFKTTKRSSSYSVSRTDQILTNALNSVVGDLHTDGFDIQASGASTGSLMRVRGIYAVDNEL